MLLAWLVNAGLARVTSRAMNEIQYAMNGGVHLAYWVQGEGPADIMIVPPWFSNLDMYEDFPPIDRALRQFPPSARLIMWDRRGSGLSDRLVGPATLEEGMDDLLAVLDAADSESAALFGLNESGSLCALTAATHPERVSHLILYGTYAATIRQEDYPWAPTPEERAEQVELITEHWGTSAAPFMMNPSTVDDEAFQRWARRWQRNSVTPDAVPLFYETLVNTDVRRVLPTIKVPTLVLHRRGDQVVPIENGRYLADKIPDAKLVELDGDDHIPFFGDWQSVADEVDEFVLGERFTPVDDRVLATLLFTDIVDSTAKASQLGDTGWRAVLDEHDAIAKKHLDRFSGKLVKSTGDGMLATFDGPARAIRCALSMCEALHKIGLSIRAGVHTGEVEVRGQDVGGIAVHIGARVMSLAEKHEVLVSGTVPPLIAGSGIGFEERGVHTLRGVPGEWHLFVASLSGPN